MDGNPSQQSCQNGTSAPVSDGFLDEVEMDGSDLECSMHGLTAVAVKDAWSPEQDGYRAPLGLVERNLSIYTFLRDPMGVA
jgi:hypothetical protein